MHISTLKTCLCSLRETVSRAELQDLDEPSTSNKLSEYLKKEGMLI